MERNLLANYLASSPRISPIFFSRFVQWQLLWNECCCCSQGVSFFTGGMRKTSAARRLLAASYISGEKTIYGGVGVALALEMVHCRLS